MSQRNMALMPKNSLNVAMMSDWDPAKYLKFANERSRPALDLLLRVTHRDPKLVYDLGCGPGNSTELLAEHFPKAEIAGIDSSPAMIAAAGKALPQLKFEIADVADWDVPLNADLAFANAVFQWVPQHDGLLLNIISNMKRGGALAVQMPDNLNEPSHRLMVEVALEGPWSKSFLDYPVSRSALLGVQGYHDLLSPVSQSHDIWRTTYYHTLSGHQGIIDMISSTGLRPYMDRLSDDQRTEYLRIYRSKLEEWYPLTKEGQVLYPFPRLFIVAVSAGR
jgi:trans-aconitate 2-methyltransferase